MSNFYSEMLHNHMVELYKQKAKDNASSASYQDTISDVKYSGCSGACKNSTPKPKPKPQRVAKWSFKASSNTLIQLDKITRELSYAHPIAFTSRQKSISHIVMLHPSLVFKAHKCGLDLPFEVANASQIMSYYLVLRTSDEGLYDIIKWVKKVKAASFPTREPNETVTVTLL
jgi:hypothetical protein